MSVELTGGSSLVALRLRRPAIFYGWYVVCVLAISLAVSAGARFTFGVVLKDVTDEFGWDRSVFAGAAALSMLLNGFLGPAVGALVDRIGSRKTMVIGLLLGTLVMFAMSGVQELWQAYLVYGLLAGIAFSTTSPVVKTPITSAWFRRQRGTAMAVVQSGMAIGQLVIVPVSAYLLVAFSWRGSYQFLGLLMLLVMLPLVLVVLRDRPEDRGLLPDGDSASPTARTSSAEPSTSIRQAWRTPTFWQLAFGVFVCGFTMTFASVHFVAYAADMEMDTMVAAQALGLAGGLSLVGAWALGWLSDRIGRRVPLAVTFGLRALAFAILLATTSEAFLFVFAVILGLSWTSVVPLSSALTADTYGQRSLGSVFGFIFTFMATGSAVGAYLSGFIYDLNGSYELAIAINGGLALAAALTTLLIYEPGRALGRGIALPAGTPELKLSSPRSG